jgi:quercetin dioxygenase-like cupin family protein
MNVKTEPQKLPWQAGKVQGFCSKDLLHQDAASIRLLKIEPGAAYPPHIHPDKTEFVYILEGEAHLHIADQSYTAQPGEFYVFPQMIRHSISNPQPASCTLLIGAIQEDMVGNNARVY